MLGKRKHNAYVPEQLSEPQHKKTDMFSRTVFPKDKSTLNEIFLKPMEVGYWLHWGQIFIFACKKYSAMIWITSSLCLILNLN